METNHELLPCPFERLISMIDRVCGTTNGQWSEDILQDIRSSVFELKDNIRAKPVEALPADLYDMQLVRDLIQSVKDCPGAVDALDAAESLLDNIEVSLSIPSIPLFVAEQLAVLVNKLDQYYGIDENSWENGCEHGFKPATKCPNENCEFSNLLKLKDKAISTYNIIK